MDRPLKGWTTALTLILAAGMTYVVPSLHRFRPISREALVRIFRDPVQGRPRTPMVMPPLPVEEPEADPEPAPVSRLARLLPMGREPRQQVDPKTPRSPMASIVRKPRANEASEPTDPAVLEDASEALGTFREALRRAEAGEGVVRITHFGDSPITGDLISGQARARLHSRFGDGGHGWILAGRPWEWYGHSGITLEASGWRVNAPALTARRDRSYGFGGVSFTALAGAQTRIATAKGVSSSRAELHYLASPSGGRVSVQVDGGEPHLLGTKGEGGPARHAIPLNGDGPHKILLRPMGDGEVTLFGLVLERDAPGVIYDAVGSNGGAIQHLARMDAGHWIESLKLRRPDLVILGFGTNECGYYNIPGPGYVQDYQEVVRRIRQALPRVSILIMAPMDRGQRNPEGGIETMPALVRIVEAQRRIAKDLGCAFFDTFRAMGGPGTAGRWYVGSPRLMTGDLTHPTHTGADRVARLLVDALQRESTAAAGLPDLQKQRPVAEARAESGQDPAGPRAK